MIINLNNDEFNQNGLYDVCIVGAGVAGITIAIELSKKGKKVALFEGGGKEYSEKSQSIYKAKNTDSIYYGLRYCRLRYLGGTSNHWTGRKMLLQPIDFKERNLFPLPGWPIKKEELDKYKNKAFSILGLDEDMLDDPEIAELSSSSTMRSVGLDVSVPPLRFGKKYYNELQNSKNIDLFLNANLTDIKLNNSFNHVSKLSIKNYKNHTYGFSGKQCILAMGAIENARLLLNCNTQIPKGIGNHSDLVGRCFMEHFWIVMGRYSRNPKNSIWSPEHPIWSKLPQLEFFPTDKFVIDNKIMTSVIAFQTASSESYGRLKAIKEKLKEAACISEISADLFRDMFDFHCKGDGIITTLCEQSPNLDSRVTLGSEKDSLGLRRAVVNWNISDIDKRTIRTLAKETAKEVARMDIGRVRLMDYIMSDDVELKPDGHCHQMGTTRMSHLPKDGVVDVNSKVFGIDNLFVAGSSIFPTGGGVNPTVSIIQLSLRLAEHLLTLK